MADNPIRSLGLKGFPRYIFKRLKLNKSLQENKEPVNPTAKSKTAEINDKIISVIQQVVEYVNRTKRLAHLLSAHYIDIVMAREGEDTAILDEFLLSRIKSRL